MKYLAFVFSFLVTCVCVFSQDSSRDAVVSATYMNVLYRGVENPVGIAVPGVKSDKISATINDGSISKGPDGWAVRPGEKPEAIITIIVDGKKIGEKLFRVKNIPSPVAVFAGKYEGSITKESASNTDSLNVELKDFLWDLKFKVAGFTFFTTKDKMDYEVKATGNKLNDKIKTLIADCEPGKYIVFKNIVATGPDGRPKDLNDIILLIK
jgi:gliding motility-associated protein GldM